MLNDIKNSIRKGSGINMTPFYCYGLQMIYVYDFWELNIDFFILNLLKGMLNLN